MNLAFFFLLSILAIAQFALPRRYAFAPVLIAACTLPDLEVADLGVSLTLMRLLFLGSFLRAISLDRLTWSPGNPLDLLFAAWTCWAIISGLGHNPKGHDPITVRASMAFDFFAPYLYARAYLWNHDSILQFCRLLGICMILLATVMLAERVSTLNIPWTVATGSPANALSREGRVRASGPFKHPILAGTVGATSVILLGFLYLRKRSHALIVPLSCGLVVFSSSSSGPIMTLATGIGALVLWRWRTQLRTIRTLVILTAVGLHIVMKAPVWYLMARLDLAGGSTGWHRAELITKALEHFDRWWLLGTDYTRDWFAYGIDWDAQMADITNLYVQMGIRGGLLLMLLFIALILKSFQLIGLKMAALRRAGDSREFMLWCFGATLFSHSVTFLSVTYYDQSIVFFCLIIGAVPGLCAASIRPQVRLAGTGNASRTWEKQSKNSQPDVESVSL